LGENQIKILDIIKQNSYISIVELSKSVWISTTAIENNIKKLQQNWKLKRIWPDKGGSWEIIHW
jgi:DNA-binding Lrp family transcriptional regulator